jgi:hypothetical protein
MNDGKRDACWVARDRAGKRIAHGTSLRDVRGKVGKILEATP